MGVVKLLLSHCSWKIPAPGPLGMELENRFMDISIYMYAQTCIHLCSHFFLSVCMYTQGHIRDVIWVYVCVYMCFVRDACAHVWKPEVNTECVFYACPPSFLRQFLQWTGAHWWDWPAVVQVSPSLSPASPTWGYGYMLLPLLAFTWESHLRSSCLWWKYLTHRSIPRSSEAIFFKDLFFFFKIFSGVSMSVLPACMTVPNPLGD